MCMSMDMGKGRYENAADVTLRVETRSNCVSLLQAVRRGVLEGFKCKDVPSPWMRTCICPVGGVGHRDLQCMELELVVKLLQLELDNLTATVHYQAFAQCGVLFYTP